MPKRPAARPAAKRPAPRKTASQRGPAKAPLPQEPPAKAPLPHEPPAKAPLPQAPEPPARALTMLRAAAAIQATEAVGMCVAAAFAAAATAGGKSYQDASGIALTLIAFGTAVALAVVARGLARAKLWSRTPALMTQLFAGGAAIYLLDGHRLDWGVPALILAAAGLVALLTPASFRALNRGR